MGTDRLGAVTLLGSKLIVDTHPLDSSINLGGYFGCMLPVAVHGKVILATTSKAVATLDLTLGQARQALLIGLLGPARVGCCVSFRGGTGNNNRRNKCGTIGTWQLLLQVQGKTNVFLLALVGVIKDHLEGSTLHITGGINVKM